MLNNILKKVKKIFQEKPTESTSEQSSTQKPRYRKKPYSKKPYDHSANKGNNGNTAKPYKGKNNKTAQPNQRTNSKENQTAHKKERDEVEVFTEKDYYRDANINHKDSKQPNPRTRNNRRKPSSNFKRPEPRTENRTKNNTSSTNSTNNNNRPPPKNIESVFNQNSSFDAFNLSAQLVTALNKNKFEHPSEIQEHSIKHVTENKNLVCSSPTGSGKTLAFVIPTVEKIIQKKTNQVLVVAPTREIAIQIEKSFQIFSKEFNFTTGLIIGGTDMLVQKEILKKYPHVLIATPGRLVDMYEKGLVWLNYTTIAILDEVDLMLDMGFEKELSTVFNALPESVQVITYTATLPEQIKNLISKYISSYETVIIGKRMETKQSISHKFLNIPAKDKMNLLVDLLFQKKDYKIIVFFNTIDDTIKTFNLMRKKRLRNVNCIHSRKTQEQRNQAMNSFSQNSSYVLLATDIAARGIDVPKIDIVINYQLPMDPEDYIHRIGRTGRADLEGKAITFFNPHNKKENIKLKQIEKIVKSADGFQFLDNINEL